MTRTAYVTIPFAGRISVAVDFEGPRPDDDDLIEAAMDVAFEASYGFRTGDNPTAAEREADGRIEPGEWEYHRKLIEGNFFYASCAAAHVDSVDPDEDDE